MRSRLASLPILALALLAVLLAGCGSSASQGNGVASKTPVQILAAARSAAVGAASVHVAGSIVSEGKPISLDMELVGSSGGKGRLTLGGLGIELIDVDRSVYVKGSPSFYTRFAGPAAARLLRGKWLKGSAKQGPLAPFAQLADLGNLIDITLDDHGTLSRGPATTIDGQKAIGVSDAAHDGTLYASTVGAPYPLEIAKPGAGRIVFDRWNKPVTLAVPTNAINIKQLHSVG